MSWAKLFDWPRRKARMKRFSGVIRSTLKPRFVRLAIVTLCSRPIVPIGLLPRVSNWDREGPHGLPPPTPPGIRITYHGDSVDYSDYNALCKEPAGFTHTLPHTLFAQHLSSHHPKAGLMNTRLMSTYPLIPFRPSVVAVRLGLSVAPPFGIGVPQ